MIALHVADLGSILGSPCVPSQIPPGVNHWQQSLMPGVQKITWSSHEKDPVLCSDLMSPHLFYICSVWRRFGEHRTVAYSVSLEASKEDSTPGPAFQRGTQMKPRAENTNPGAGGAAGSNSLLKRDQKHATSFLPPFSPLSFWLLVLFPIVILSFTDLPACWLLEDGHKLVNDLQSLFEASAPSGN